MSKNVHILQLAEYKQPVLQENSRDAWVGWGEDNNYFHYLIERYTKSTTNNAIINNVARLIYGKGLSALDASRKPNEYAQMMTLFSADCVRKMVFDRKLFGQFAIQVHYNDKHDKILKAYHIPVNLLRAEKCNEKGEITGYYYSDNWEEVRKFPPMRIPAFGFSKEKIEILFVKPYGVGMKYYAYPDYQGALPYAVLEEEVSDYLINEVQNGFSGTKVVNFNNGVPSEEQQDLISQKVLSRLTGSKGQKVIVAFNSNQESKTTVDDIPLNDAPDHYTYLSEECLRKIMLGHNVTSPLLFGIASTNGFSSNADELQNSFILFNNMVIKPFQDEILEAFDKLLAFNGIALKLFFRTLKPLEFTDLENAQTEDQVTEETGADATQLKSQEEQKRLAIILDNLKGEVVDEEWEKVDERKFSDDNEPIEEWATRLIKPKQSLAEKLSSFIKSKQNGFSYLDKSIYKVRYRYSEWYKKENQRDFCSVMMSRTANGVVYRLEDIDAASRAGVNKELGHKGKPYDLFRFKGGVNCGHYWTEELFRLKKKTDGTYYEDKALSSSEQVATIPNSYMPNPRGSADAVIPPYDMPNHGHHPNYKKD